MAVSRKRSLAAKKAWRTRRKRFGKDGMRGRANTTHKRTTKRRKTTVRRRRR